MSPDPSTLACNSATSHCCYVASSCFHNTDKPPPPECLHHLFVITSSLSHFSLARSGRPFCCRCIWTLPFIKHTLLPFLCTHIGAYVRIVAIQHNPLWYNLISMVFFWNVEIYLIRQKHHFSWYQMPQSFVFFKGVKHGEIILISNWHSRVAKLRR